MPKRFKWAADVEGYAREHECRYLYDFACKTPADGVIVELGTYKGRTAIALAQSGRHVYAIDHFEAEDKDFIPLNDHRIGNYTADEVRANAKRYGVEIDVINNKTLDAGRRWLSDHEQIDLLFIDADHHYEAVRADFEAWSPFVAPDGVVIFDDVLFSGPMRLLAELQEWEPVPGPQAGGMMALRRAAVVEEAAMREPEPMTDTSDPAAEPHRSLPPSVREVHPRDRQRRLVFDRDDVFTTWRVLSHNPDFTGETESFGFHRGVATIGALARTVSEARVQERLRRLHAMNSYQFSDTRTDQRGQPHLVTGWTYTFLTDDEYERQYGGDEDIDAVELDEVAAL